MGMGEALSLSLSLSALQRTLPGREPIGRTRSPARRDACRHSAGTCSSCTSWATGATPTPASGGGDGDGGAGASRPPHCQPDLGI